MEDMTVVRKRVQVLLEATCAARITKEDNLLSLIKPGLYLGSVGATLNKNELKALNIIHVLVVAQSFQPAFLDELIYKKIDVLDSSETHLDDYFVECIVLLTKRNSLVAVLVHCFAGRSRSALIVVAYLMKKNQTTRNAALSLVTSKRYGMLVMLASSDN